MKNVWLIGILLFMTALPATATEFYRYVDPQGNVLYTDDLSKVPPQQRDQVNAYVQSETSTPQNQPVPGKSKNEVDSDLNQERTRLEAAGKVLDAEFETLTEERNQLDEEKNEAVTNEQIKAYNQKIVEFNSRIKAYEEKRNTHTSEVEAFNAQLKN